jgi:hypothetical protein
MFDSFRPLDIEAAMERRKVATLVTVDVEGAFDAVLRNRDGLCHGTNLCIYVPHVPTPLCRYPGTRQIYIAGPALKLQVLSLSPSLLYSTTNTLYSPLCCAVTVCAVNHRLRR